MSIFVDATDNFSRDKIIYNGVYTMYRGRDLKRFNNYVIYRWRHITGDISNLRGVYHLSHPNLASMIGYCLSNDKTIVGYRNTGLRTLLSHLIFNINRSSNAIHGRYNLRHNISWLSRLNICIGVADALRCLHIAKLVHGGISPTTILVDSSFSPKLVTIGSFLGCSSDHDNYRRPELFPPGVSCLSELNENSDVYMFGLLLFIMLCGKKTNFSHGYTFLLPDIVSKAMKARTLHRIIDMNVNEIEHNCMVKFLEIAFCCCSHEQVDRPSMNIVLKGLRQAQALQVPKW